MYMGYSFTAPYTAKQETEILAPRLWIQLLQWVSESHLKNQPLKKVALSHFRKNDFTYFVTVEMENLLHIPKGMTALCVPEMYYARSTHRSILDLQKVTETYEKIIRLASEKGWSWMDSSLHLEVYDERFQPKAAQTNFDIYVPVNKTSPRISK
jgi:predicted transcriptional regulator YdeE